MNKKVIKNFIFILNNAVLFVFANIMLWGLATEIFNWVMVLIICLINIPSIIAFIIGRKFTMSTIYFTDEGISAKLFSKELCSYRWENFDNISFQYRTIGIGSAPTVRFYIKEIKGKKHVLEYELTKKSLAYLKDFDEKLKPHLKSLVDSMELRRGRLNL